MHSTSRLQPAPVPNVNPWVSVGSKGLRTSASIKANEKGKGSSDPESSNIVIAHETDLDPLNTKVTPNYKLVTTNNKSDVNVDIESVLKVDSHQHGTNNSTSNHRNKTERHLSSNRKTQAVDQDNTERLITETADTLKDLGFKNIDDAGNIKSFNSANRSHKFNKSGYRNSVSGYSNNYKNYNEGGVTHRNNGGWYRHSFSGSSGLPASNGYYQGRYHYPEYRHTYNGQHSKDNSSNNSRASLIDTEESKTEESKTPSSPYSTMSSPPTLFYANMNSAPRSPQFDKHGGGYIVGAVPAYNGQQGYTGNGMQGRIGYFPAPMPMTFNPAWYNGGMSRGYLTANGVIIAGPGYSNVTSGYGANDLEEDELVKQLIYYFSIENLCKDVYLRNHMDKQGWINIKLFLEFPKIKRMGKNYEDLENGFKNVENVEVNNGLVRLKEGWEKWVIK